MSRDRKPLPSVDHPQIKESVQESPTIHTGLSANQQAVLHAQQTIGNAAVRRMIVQREPSAAPTQTNSVSGSISDIVTWTVPDLSSDWAASTASAIEAQGQTESFVSNNQMAEAGWNALTGSEMVGNNIPSELLSTARAGKADANAAKKSIDKALGSRQNALAKVDAVRSV